MRQDCAVPAANAAGQPSIVTVQMAAIDQTDASARDG
jgi:hypothetical protein